MGDRIFSKSLGIKATVGVVLAGIAFSCYASSFGPIINTLHSGFSSVIAQATRAASQSLAKLANIDDLSNKNLMQSTRMADLTKTLGDTIGVPLQVPNPERFKSIIGGWMKDFITNPTLMLGSANALNVPDQTVPFGETEQPLDLKIDFNNTHRQIEDQLIAHNDTPAESRRLASLREYMIEDATVSGVTLATVNKQTTNKTRDWIRRISNASVESKSLREDVKTTNDYLMVVALELTNIRELQAQQLELMSAFARTFSEPKSHLEAKNRFRQQRDSK